MKTCKISDVQLVGPGRTMKWDAYVIELAKLGVGMAQVGTLREHGAPTENALRSGIQGAARRRNYRISVNRAVGGSRGEPTYAVCYHGTREKPKK